MAQRCAVRGKRRYHNARLAGRHSFQAAFQGQSARASHRTQRSDSEEIPRTLGHALAPRRQRPQDHETREQGPQDHTRAARR